ncbi:MAG TPA: hypothetical protein VID74_07470 [Gemmatimonadales bacterium]
MNSMLLLVLQVLAGPRPAAAPARYKIVTRTNTDIDLSAAGQGSQTIALVSTTFVTVTLVDTTGGQLVNIVVDSSAFDGGAIAAQLPAEMLADPKGASFHLLVVNGRSRSSILPTPMSVQAVQAAGGIELLLTSLRRLKAGDTWTDTTMSDTSTAAGSAKGSRVATWTAKPDQGNTLQLDATWTGTTSAGFGQAQIEMKVAGTSHVTAVPGGLAQKANSTGTGSATMNMAGMNLPMKVTTDVTTTQLP